MARTLSMAIGVLVVLATLFLLPIELPYSIQVPGKMVPQREWVLCRGQEGCLTTTLYDHVQGTIESYTVTEVDRGDYMTFWLHPKMVDGASVAVGDTVGVMYSTQAERAWVQLQGELDVERALLRLNRTGEKASVIEEARLQLAYAQKQAEHQRRETERLRGLSQKGFIPATDLETAETTLRLYEIQVDIAEAQLRTVQTGVREEEIEVVRARIGSLQEEMEVLGRRLWTSTLVAPIGGRLVHFLSGDTLAVLQDTRGYAVFSPVRWKDRAYVELRQPVEIRGDGLGSRLSGTIERLGHTAHVVNRGQGQVFGVVSTVREGTAEVIPGLIVGCSIQCAPVRPFEYAWRFLNP